MESVEIKSSTLSSCQVETEAEERPSSPNDCAICLEQLSDKSFTNSCLHMFCFHCLLAWSKVKPECPLCKQDFCSIIHNIRSMDDYDEYHVPPAAMRFTTPDSTSFISQMNTTSDYLHRQHDYFSTNRRFFSYRTTFIPPGTFSVPRERPSSLVIQPYVDNLQIQNNYASLSSSTSSLNRLNRKDVYIKELELHPSTSGRHRICSPEFYRDNESQMHRLGRWVNRELTVLSSLGTRFDISIVFSLIMERLPNYDIQSTMFFNSLFPHLGVYTRRFIKEFYNFAISPYDMEEYDRMCVYTRKRTGSSLAFIVTVNSDENEDVQVIPNPPENNPVRIRPWIDLAELSTPFTSSLLENRSSRFLSTPSCSRLPSTTRNLSQQVIDISDSENDDCVIIEEMKTTPETIVLDESDVENSSTVPLLSSSPIPSTSGYRPPAKTNTEAKNIPSIHYTYTSCNPSTSGEALFKGIPRRRSGSCSSVMSTDNSVIESESGIKNESGVKKENEKKCKQSDKSENSSHFKVTFAIASSDSLSSSSNDSDWEDHLKKKKKLRKHAEKAIKKVRKRKKTERCKSPKRKKIADAKTTHKSKHISKRKSKNPSKSSESCISTSTSKITSAECSVCRDTRLDAKNESNFSPIRPKLRSIVQKVEKKSVVDDNLPSTSSYAFRPKDLKLQSLIFKRAMYSSDSDF